MCVIVSLPTHLVCMARTLTHKLIKGHESSCLQKGDKQTHAPPCESMPKHACTHGDIHARSRPTLLGCGLLGDQLQKVKGSGLAAAATAGADGQRASRGARRSWMGTTTQWHEGTFRGDVAKTYSSLLQHASAFREREREAKGMAPGYSIRDHYPCRPRRSTHGMPTAANECVPFGKGPLLGRQSKVYVVQAFMRECCTHTHTHTS